MPVLEGTTLGRYRLQRLLGRGGMSEVYLAHDEEMDRDVAVKLVNRNQADYVERFQREVAAMGILAHEHILPAYDNGEDGPWCYLAMPFIEHGTLSQRLRTKGPLTLEEAGIILAQVGSALQFAHERGILHRDIKASNILLRDEQHVYLADFGLAKAMEKDSDITQTGCVMGTPEYMAPELMERPASRSSDIYAVGILLYQMVTGRLPFRGSTPLSVCFQHMQEQPVRPSLLNPAIPLPVEQVILCALEKDPRNRFKSTRALVQAYQQALETSDQSATIPKLAQPPLQAARAFNEATTIQPSPQPLVSWLPQHRSRNRLAIATLAVLVVLFITSLTAGFLGSNSNAQTATPVGTGASTTFGNSTPTIHGTPTAKSSNTAQPGQSTPAAHSTPTIRSSSGVPANQQHGHGKGKGHKH